MPPWHSSHGTCGTRDRKLSCSRSSVIKWRTSEAVFVDNLSGFFSPEKFENKSSWLIFSRLKVVDAEWLLLLVASCSEDEWYCKETETIDRLKRVVKSTSELHAREGAYNPPATPAISASKRT